MRRGECTKGLSNIGERLQTRKLTYGTNADEFEQVLREDITLSEAVLGYTIGVYGEGIGSIEGVPGHLEYLVIEPHWQGKGAGRSALIQFLELSREAGKEEAVTNNVVHDAMEHVLQTEGFERRSDDIGWVKEI